MAKRREEAAAAQCEAGAHPVGASLSQRAPSSVRGLTMIELIITITILAILTMGAIPMVKTAVRRQREYRLRETLREMREAIKDFKRDTAGPVNCPGQPPADPNKIYIDPRSKVQISDCTIFSSDNPDHYPPDLETLVRGVSVIPRSNMVIPNSNSQPTDNKLLSTKKKIYLREIPVDPITGEKDWCVRSSYDPADDGCSSSPVNVFDVRSKAEGEALNGEKYSDW